MLVRRRGARLRRRGLLRRGRVACGLDDRAAAGPEKSAEAGGGGSQSPRGAALAVALADRRARNVRERPGANDHP